MSNDTFIIGVAIVCVVITAGGWIYTQHYLKHTDHKGRYKK